MLDKRTDTYGRIQDRVCWAGYGKASDSWVDEEDANDHLKQAFRMRHQGELNFKCLIEENENLSQAIVEMP